MKKIALVLAIIALTLPLLASCSKDENANVITHDRYVDVNNPNGTPSTQAHKNYEVTPGVRDYDNDGNLIVTSTDNRYVYKSDLGYIIFSFNQKSDTCFQVLEVRALEDEEKATQYTTEHVVEMMNSGNYVGVNQAGRYVVFTVSVENEIYGKYLALTRADVEKDMPESMKCN